MKNQRFTYLMWLIPLIPLIADRITKMLVLAYLVIPKAPCYGLNLLRTWNSGISWSMLRTIEPWRLITLQSLLIIALVVYVALQMRKGSMVVGELLLIGGAFSNIVDRLMYGAVLDFIELYIGPYHWPVFNIADIFIVGGVGIMLIKNWRERHD
ncbi:MAG: signal peptidase II [Candidatus Babeliales bacterium]|jgi:signal peptidase II